MRPRRNAALPTTTSSRFSVRALFDDGVDGDITRLLAIDWSPSRNVDANGRLIVAAGDAGGPPITITAALTDHPSVAPATGTLRVVEPWGPSTPIETRLVPGGGLPNPSALEAMPNVLFLPDGFDASQEGDFYRYVNALVQFLKTDPLCKPFDLLATSMNFWAAFLPSEQRGVTMGSEVFEDGSLSNNVRPLRQPKRPQGVSDWGVGELVYEVGFPLPSDALSNTALTNNEIIDRWTRLHFRPRLPAEPHRRETLINKWRLMASRTLLDDLDTPLGIRSGSPRPDLYHNSIGMNPDRMDRRRLEDLLAALRHDDFANSRLDRSRLWVGNLRRNYDLICIIVPTEGRALNTDGYFIVRQDPRRSNASSSGPITLPPPTFNATPSPLESRLLAHELAHSFDLGNEYGGSETRRLDAPTIALVQRVYTNLVSPDSLLRSAGGSQRIHGDELKWRWPRVRWAVELIGPITARGGGVFEAPIRGRQRLVVPVGEIVHLRYRNIDHAFRDVRYVERSSYLTKGVKVSVPLRLVETFETGNPPVQNVRLRVESSAPFGHAHSIRVEPADFVAEFPAGSIVYAPTRAPTSAFDPTSYPYAELIAKKVRDYITRRIDAGRSAAVGDPTSGFPENPDYQDFTFPTAFRPRRTRPWWRSTRVVWETTSGFFTRRGALEVIELESVGDSGARRAHSRAVFRWEEIPKLLQDPHLILQRVYGWGTDTLAFDQISYHLASFLVGLGFPVVILEPDEDLLTRYASDGTGRRGRGGEGVKWPFYYTSVAGTPVELSVQVLPLPARGTL